MNAEGGAVETLVRVLSENGPPFLRVFLGALFAGVLVYKLWTRHIEARLKHAEIQQKEENQQKEDMAKLTFDTLSAQLAANRTETTELRGITQQQFQTMATMQQTASTQQKAITELSEKVEHCHEERDAIKEQSEKLTEANAQLTLQNSVLIAQNGELRDEKDLLLKAISLPGGQRRGDPALLHESPA